MAKIHIENGIISSSADYSLYHGTSPLATIEAGGLRVQGDVIAENMIVSSSTTYMTTSFSAGSTAFGDSTDDTHQFTGSLKIHSGSIDINSSSSPNYAILGKSSTGKEYFKIRNSNSESFPVGRLQLNYSDSNVSLISAGSNQLRYIGGENTSVGSHTFLAGNNTTEIAKFHGTNGLTVSLGNISGSSTSTGSFGSVFVGNINNGKTLSIGDNTRGNHKIYDSSGYLRFDSSIMLGNGYIYSHGVINLDAGANDIRLGSSSGGANTVHFKTDGSTDGITITQNHITSSGNFSSSLASTGSFGSVVAGGTGTNTFTGDVTIGTTTPGSAPGSVLTLDNSSGASYTQYNAGTSGGGIVGTEGNNLVFYTYPGNLGSESYSKHMTITPTGQISGSSTSTGSFGTLRSTQRLTLDVPAGSPAAGGSTTRGLIDINHTQSGGDAHLLTFNSLNSHFYIMSDQGRMKFYSSPSPSYDGTGQAGFMIMADMDDDGTYMAVGNGNLSNIPLQVKPNMISGSAATTGSFGGLETAGNSRFSGHLDMGTKNITNWNTLQSQGNLYLDNGGFIDSRGSGDLTFRTTDSVTTRMVIKNAGNVGIGTSSPTLGKLQVNISGNTRGLHINATDSNASYMQFSNSSTGTATNAGLQVGLQTDESAFVSVQHNAHLQFNTYSTERLRIHAGGTVEFKGANQVISGSSTSTGSFGSLVVADAVQGDLSVKEGTLTLEKSPAALSWTPGASEMLVLKRHTSSGAFTGMTLQSGGAGKSFINFGDTANNDQGQIAYNNTTDAFEITANTTKVLDITSTKISGSSTSTGSFGAVSIGKGTADNGRALTIVGNVQLNNNNYIYFKRSNGNADPHIAYDSSNNFKIFNPVSGEIQLMVGSAEIVAVDGGGLTFNGSKTIGSSAGAGVITILGNSGLKLKSGGGGGSGPIELIQGSTTYWSVGPEGNLTGSADLVMNAGKNISGSSTSTGSFGHLITNDARFQDDIYIGSSGTSGFRDGSDSNISVYIANTQRFKWYNNGGNIYFGSNNASGPNIYSAASSTTNATYRISGITNTGWGGGTDKISGIIGGTEVLQIAANKISGSATSTGSFGNVHVVGRLGIGTTNTFEPVVAYPDQDIKAVFGRVVLHSVSSDTAMFSHYDNRNSSAAYALRQDSTGTTTINAKTGKKILFGINNQYKMTVSGDNVGIGTTDPDEKLHVVGNIFATGNISGSSTSTGSFGQLQIQPDTDSGFAKIGRTFIGTTHSDHAGFSHVDQALSSGGYALVQSSGGITALNAASGQKINFNINNSNIAIINEHGLGINATPADDIRLRVKASDNDDGIQLDDQSGNSLFKVFQQSDGIGRLFVGGSSSGTVFTVTGGADASYVNAGRFGVGVTSPTTELDVSGSIQLNGNFGNETFTTGFGGAGFRIGKDATNLYEGEFDNLFVRGRMTVFELLINQIRASNGAVYVSDAAKVESVTPVNATTFKLNFDTGSGYGHPFQANDLLKAQRFNGSSVYVSRMTVTGIAGTNGLTASLQGGDTPPSGGFEFVRVGNTNDTDRQGAIYLTNSDNGAPFMDVYDGVTSHVFPTGSQYLKVRVGKLDGVSSPTFTIPDNTYGFYASGSAFLEGKINATAGGFIAGWSLNTSTIEKVDSNGGVKIDSSNKRIDFLSDASTTRLRVGQVDSNKFGMRGFNDGGNRVFEISEVRNEIAGWSIQETVISSSDGNVQIDAGNSRFLIKSGSGERVRMGLLNNSSQYGISGSDENGNLLFKLGDAGNEIAGWEIAPGLLRYDNASGSIALDASNQNISIHTGSVNTAKPKVVMGNLPTTGDQRYGFAVFSGSGDADISDDDSYSVLITRDKARLAGWDLVPGRLKSGTVADINGNKASIALGGGSGGTNALNAGATPTPNLFFVSASSSPIFYVGENFSYVNDTLTAAGWTLNSDGFSDASDNIQLSSTHASMSLGQKVLIEGGTNSTIRGGAHFSSLAAFDNEQSGFVLGQQGSDTIFEVNDGGSNFIIFDSGAGTPLKVQSSNFTLGSTDFKLTNTFLKLGTIDSTSDYASTERGFYVDSSGNVLIKGSVANNNYIRFNGTSIEIKSNHLELAATNLTASSDSQFLHLGPPTKVSGNDWESSTGVFFSGSGEFRIASGSNSIQYSKTNNAITMNFANFSVDAQGKINATDGTFSGDISATSGFFGDAAGLGWVIDGNTIKNASGSIFLNANPAQTSIGVSNTGGTFIGEIVPDYSPTSDIFSSGTAYVDTSIPTTSVTIGTDAADGVTRTAGSDLFIYYTSTSSATAATSLGTPPVLTVGVNYRATVVIEITIFVNTPNYANTNYTLMGNAQVGGTLNFRKQLTDLSSVSLDRTIIGDSFGSGTTLRSFTYTKSITFDFEASATAEYNAEVFDFSVTNNGIQERYETFIGEGKPPIVSTIDTTIDSTSKVVYTDFTLQPSSKKTQMAPGGFQTVNMGNSTLESSDNTYVRTDVAGAKTLDIQGHMDITGSLNIKALGDTFEYQRTMFDGQNLYLPTSLIHSGDTDTKITFNTDKIEVNAGGLEFVEFVEGSTDFTCFNQNGADINFRIEADATATTGGMKDLDFAFFLDAGWGQLGIGDAPEDTYRGRVLQVIGEKSSAYALRVWNDGNNSTNNGMLVQCGQDSGTGTLIKFQDGDGHDVGEITFSGGTVTYGNFTGVHNAYIMESDGVARNLPSSSLELYYQEGTIVSMVSSSKDNTFQPVNFVVSSSTYQDKRAYGVYMGSHDWDSDDPEYHIDLVDKHKIASIGDGFVLVNNQGGDIEIGDYITTASGSGGYGCKQSDDLLHNYTVAKATDSVTWSEHSGSIKLLACTYHCG